MAGYNGHSKSNNAIEAEHRGLMTASAVAKLIGHGATAAGVVAVLRPAEWHHTSKMYNATDYYDYEIDQENGAEDGRDIDTEILAASKQEKGGAATLTGAIVAWLEWGGTRKRPIASEKTAAGCTVKYKGGAFCTVTLPNGKTMRKKLSTKGFSINGTYPETAIKKADV